MQWALQILAKIAGFYNNFYGDLAWLFWVDVVLCMVMISGMVILIVISKNNAN